IVRSDHLAIVAYNGKVKQAINKTSVKTLYRKRIPAQHALLLNYAPSLIHEFAIATSRVQIEFDQFYSTLTSILDQFYPQRTISLTWREPSYVTPELKSMLRRRDVLMRASRVEEASALGEKIGALIIKRNSAYPKENGEKFDLKNMCDKV